MAELHLLSSHASGSTLYQHRGSLSAEILIAGKVLGRPAAYFHGVGQRFVDAGRLGRGFEATLYVRAHMLCDLARISCEGTGAFE